MRKGKVIIASMMVLCVLIFLIAIAWFMLFQGEMTAPTEEEKKLLFYRLRAYLRRMLRIKNRLRVYIIVRLSCAR